MTFLRSIKKKYIYIAYENVLHCAFVATHPWNSFTAFWEFTYWFPNLVIKMHHFFRLTYQFTHIFRCIWSRDRNTVLQFFYCDTPWTLLVVCWHWHWHQHHNRQTKLRLPMCWNYSFINIVYSFHSLLLHQTKEIEWPLIIFLSSLVFKL